MAARLRNFLSFLCTIALLFGAVAAAPAQAQAASAYQATAEDLNISYQIEHAKKAYIEEAGYDEWAAIADRIDGKKVPTSFVKQAEAAVVEAKGEYPYLTGLAKAIMGLSAAQRNVTNIKGINLLKLATDKKTDDFSYVNEYAWILLAYDSGVYTVPSKANISREFLIRSLLDKQLKGGGWSFSGNEIDPDITGPVLMALSPYKNIKEVQQAIDKAVNALKKVEVDNSNSVACMIMGLASVGVDPTDKAFYQEGQDLIGYLFSFKTKNGSYKWKADDEEGNAFSTKDALTAYQAYNAFKKKAKYHIYYGLKGSKSKPKVDEKKITGANKQQTAQVSPSFALDKLIVSADPAFGLGQIVAQNKAVSSSEEQSSFAKEQIEVTVEVNSQVDHKKLPVKGTVTLEPGATAFDALLELVGEKNVKYTGRKSTVYVQAIFGLEERQYGSMSGWIYEVNGKSPNRSAGAEKLKDGDFVEWMYQGEDEVRARPGRNGKDNNGRDESGSGGTGTGGSGDGDTGTDETGGNSDTTDGNSDFTDDDTQGGNSSGGTKKGNSNKSKNRSSSSKRTSSSTSSSSNSSSNTNSSSYAATITGTFLGGNSTNRQTGNGFALAQLPSPVPVERYLDWNHVSDYAKDSVKKAIDAEWMQGQMLTTGDWVFEPKRAVTRAEFVAILVTVISGKPDAPAEVYFSDVERSSWYYPYFAKAIELNLVAGYADGSMRPGDIVTREQAAVMLARALQLPVAQSDQTFQDVPTSSYANPFITAVHAAGIMSGDDQGRFFPKQVLNREALAVITVRLLDRK